MNVGVYEPRSIVGDDDDGNGSLWNVTEISSFTDDNGQKYDLLNYNFHFTIPCYLLLCRS